MADVNIQDTGSPDYVNAIELVKLAQANGINITRKFLLADTPAKRVELRDWLNAEIERRKHD